MRTDKEILDQTESLASSFAAIQGFNVKTPNFKYQHTENARINEYWLMACKAQELLTDTDPNNCEEDEIEAALSETLKKYLEIAFESGVTLEEVISYGRQQNVL